MTVMLLCDAPDCDKSVPAIPRMGQVTCPSGWWLNVGPARIVVACCTDHLNVATERRVA